MIFTYIKLEYMLWDSIFELFVKKIYVVWFAMGQLSAEFRLRSWTNVAVRPSKREVTSVYILDEQLHLLVINITFILQTLCILFYLCILFNNLSI